MEIKDGGPAFPSAGEEMKTCSVEYYHRKWVDFSDKFIILLPHGMYELPLDVHIWDLDCVVEQILAEEDDLA